MSLAARMIALMLALARASRAKTEPVDEQRARYAEIAHAIVDVAAGPREAALLFAIAFHESGFKKDVDEGTTRGAAGECGVFQLMPSKRSLSCEEAFGDRTAQAKRALEIARRSIRACGHGEVELAAYASGRCDRGLEESRAMVLLARRFFLRLEPVSTAGLKGLR